MKGPKKKPSEEEDQIPQWLKKVQKEGPGEYKDFEKLFGDDKEGVGTEEVKGEEDDIPQWLKDMQESVEPQEDEPE